MRFTQAVITALTLALLAPSVARADVSKRQGVGVAAIIVGSLSVVVAFDYDPDVCPAGYTTHYFDDIPTQCSYIGRTYTDFTEATTKATLLYPGALYGGLATVGVGILLVALPKKAQKYAPSVNVSPSAVTVGKTLRW